MKQSSLKILLWLYPFDLEERCRFVKVVELKLLLPELTGSGLRSLLFLLEKKQFLASLNLPDSFQLKLTPLGKQALEAQIPALTRMNLTQLPFWSALVFLQPPALDKNFRYLRSYLLAQKALPLTRGVYLYPGQLSETIQNLLNSSYANCVLVMAVKQFFLSDEQKVIGSIFGLSDTIRLLSGISKEIDELLIKKSKINKLTDQSKRQAVSIFDRLLEYVRQDYGLVRYFLPQAKSAGDYFFQLQQILEL